MTSSPAHGLTSGSSSYDLTLQTEDAIGGTRGVSTLAGLGRGRWRTVGWTGRVHRCGATRSCVFAAIGAPRSGVELEAAGAAIVHRLRRRNSPGGDLFPPRAQALEAVGRSEQDRSRRLSEAAGGTAADRCRQGTWIEFIRHEPDALRPTLPVNPGALDYTVGLLDAGEPSANAPSDGVDLAVGEVEALAVCPIRGRPRGWSPKELSIPDLPRNVRRSCDLARTDTTRTGAGPVLAGDGPATSPPSDPDLAPIVARPG